jgi:L-threonylcarbamoyladenylate synthase
MLEYVATSLNLPGSVGVIPTDTVYGVVARADDKSAVSRLYELKKRENKPGTLIAADIDQLVNLGIKKRYLKAVEQFWPGPVSVVVPVGDPLLSYLHQGKLSLAIRIPDSQELLNMLRSTGPLITSSANQPNEPPAVNIEEAKSYFGNKVDFYIDGGDLSKRKPSTIIRIVDDTIEVIRQGAIKIEGA